MGFTALGMVSIPFSCQPLDGRITVQLLRKRIAIFRSDVFSIFTEFLLDSQYLIVLGYPLAPTIDDDEQRTSRLKIFKIILYT